MLVLVNFDFNIILGTVTQALVFVIEYSRYAIVAIVHPLLIAVLAETEAIKIVVLQVLREDALEWSHIAISGRRTLALIGVVTRGGTVSKAFAMAIH